MEFFGTSLFSSKILWLLILHFLLLFDVPILCCVQCSEDAERLFRDLQNNVIQDLQGLDSVEEYYKFKQYIMAAYESATEPLKTRFIDLKGLQLMHRKMKKVYDLIEKSKVKGVQLVTEIAINLKRLGQSLLKIHRAYYDTRFCPNLKLKYKSQESGLKSSKIFSNSEDGCGMMNQTVIDCGTCKEEEIACVAGDSFCASKLIFCPALCGCKLPFVDECKTEGEICKSCTNLNVCRNVALNCGEQAIEVTEDDDLIIDCNLIWHSQLEKPYYYEFYKKEVLGSKKLAKSEQPFLIIKRVSMQDAGTYICRTGLEGNDYNVSALTINVYVLTKTEDIKQTPRPTLEPLSDIFLHTPANNIMKKKIGQHLLLIIMLCAGMIFLLVTSISIYICCVRKKRKDPCLEKNKQEMEELLEMID